MCVPSRFPHVPQFPTGRGAPMTRRRRSQRVTLGERCPTCGEVHERCAGHRNADGKQCRKWHVKGAEVCATHGGSAPQVRAAASRKVAKDGAIAEAEKVRLRLGGSLEVSPLDVLIGQVKEAAANVEVYRLAIQSLGVEVARDGAVAIPEQVIEFDKGGTHVPARVHILVDLYNQERDRAVKFAKLCLDAGVEERTVRVAERQAAALGRAFAETIDELDLSADQMAQARTVLAGKLRQIVAAS